MTVETGRLVESIVRVDDQDQLDAITFSHGLGQKLPLTTGGLQRMDSASIPAHADR
jgi:hypothetical protein